MAPISKSRHPICPSDPIDPYKPLQPEIPATLVTLEAKKVPPNPPQTWGFQAKRDPLRPVRTSITKSRLLTCLPGPIDPCKPFHPEITASLVTLEAKDVPLNPPQEWGFQAKKDPPKRLFWTH